MKKIILLLMLIVLTACGSNSNNPSKSDSKPQSSQITNSSSISNNINTSTSTNVVKTLEDIKSEAIASLTNNFNHYDIDNYSIKNWNQLLEILTKAGYEIYDSTTESEIDLILKNAITNLDNVETYDEEKQNEKVVMELNEKISTGSIYRYALSNVSNVEKLMRVKVVLDLDFKGASQNNIYWGGDITIGSSKAPIASAGYEERVDEDENDVPEATRQVINIEVTNLTSSNTVDILLTYTGGNYDIKVESLSFYYNYDQELKTEKIEVNQSIYNNKKVNLAYNELKNKGDVYKIELNLTISGNQSYTGGTIFVTGCIFSSTNTLNIGNIMTPMQTTTGSVYIYPEEKIDLSIAEEFSFTSWWAPASEIMLNYVTIYTKN